MSSRSALAALALLVLATGCSSATAEPSSRKEADVPVVSSVGKEARRLVLPFDAYAISTPQIHTIESAEDLLIRDCMREHGRGWKALPRPSGVDWDPSNRRRYGLIESEIAARFGYHLPPAPQELTRREAAWDARKKLPEQEQLAVFGKKGGGGCWKQAHESLLRGIPQSDQSLFNRRIGEEFDASRRDSEVVRVVRNWSACMKEKGFRYSAPLTAAGDAR
ncbi:hypothetical protein ACH4SK_31150 [Streptomyces inhibens]|uniref:hypothetical protein n=1 Tax=Streptomyces inhibens TaxID=2293571 RepID=UPI0037AED112